MIKKICAIFIAFTICISPIFGLSIPKQDASIYVNDYSNVLSTQTENELIKINQNSDYKTGGYVVVATFDFVEEDLYDFSYRLFNEWGVGSAEYNNGVLLVLDIGNDNYCYILGTGIEKVITDGEARDIIDTYMEPDFAAKNYDQAVLKTTKQFTDIIINENAFIIDEDYYVEEDYDGEYSGFIIETLISFIMITIFLIIVISILASIFGRSRRRYYGPSYVPPRRSFWYFGPSRTYHHHHHSGSSYRPTGGIFRSGGFSSRSSSSRSSFGSSSRSSFGGSRSSGGGRSHSGGSSRGAGGTRR